MKNNVFFKRSAKSKLAWSIAAAVAVTAGAGNLAYAQDDDEEFALEEIRVTGSRIKRQDYNSANPVTTLGADELNNLGIVNAGEALSQIPSNVARFTPENTGGSAFNIGANLADLRGLNPFFGSRTMTLVDTRRHVSTNQGGSVDLNFIPSIMISRMETVTGGASASYGADAISGVVNILLDTNLEGIKFDARYGVTGQSDGENGYMGFAFGKSFADGRGHVVFGMEAEQQDVIQDCSTARDWCGEGNGIYSNGNGGNSAFAPALTPYAPVVPGQPHNFFASDLRYSTHVNGMTFDATPGAQRYRFNDAGTDIVPWDTGLYSNQTATAQVIGGDGQSIYKNLTLMPETERQVFMAHATWDFSDNLSGFVEVSHGNVKGTNIQASPSQNTTSGCVKADNAYLLMGSTEMQLHVDDRREPDPQPWEVWLPPSCGTEIYKDWSTETFQKVETDTEVNRIAFGLDGTVFDDWSWDVYYQYGETERSQIGSDYRTEKRFSMAMDSVIDPSTNNVVCRVTLDPLALPALTDPSLADGCEPINPFGVGTSSQAGLDYAFAALTEFNTIELNAVAFNLAGELWQGWGAGSLQSAFGIEYREESFVNDAGDLPKAQRTDFGLQYGDEFSGELEALEYFAEFELPLISDMALADLWTVNLAVRQSEYTNTGGVLNISNDISMTTWKVSSVWDVNEWLKVRGSISQDARAATYRELYYSQTIPAGGWFGSVDNPWLAEENVAIGNPNVAGTQPSEIILTGNVELEPEEADTRTFGVVLTPTAIEGLQFSADYYQIELTGGIGLGVDGAPIDRCFYDNVDCGYISFGANPDGSENRLEILSNTTLYGNGSPYNSKGVDFAINYSFPLDNLFSGAGGDFSVRVLATHALETIVESGGQARNIAGQTGGDQGFLSDFSPSPDWSTNVIFTYMNGPLIVTTQARYISAGILDLQTPKYGPEDMGDAFDPNLTGTVTSNRLASSTVWNLTGSYNFELAGGGNISVYGTVDNLFDKDPQFSAGGVGGANAQFFDAMGRTFRVGLRSKF